MALFDSQELQVGDVQYLVPTSFEFVRRLGAGAYGTVAAFKHRETGQPIAVKKISRAFDDPFDGKRILREVRLLRHFHHPNIISILDMYHPPGPDFNEIYIVTDVMDTDLEKVIASGQPLTEEHHQWLVFQTLCGLRYLHSANVIHRDLKPSNLLVDGECQLKICDFGLARGFVSADDALTKCVATRWYRAPEVLLAEEYTVAIDLWAVGCIFCEMLGGEPLFPGQGPVDQLKRIVKVVGSPSDDDLAWMGGGPGKKFLHKCGTYPAMDLSSLFPSASSAALSFASGLLRFDPAKRLTVEGSLEHPFLVTLRMYEEPLAATVIDWEFDNFEPTRALLQQHLHEECVRYRAGGHGQQASDGLSPYPVVSCH